MKEVTRVENLVLGAGIAGLGAGYELPRRNCRLTLFVDFPKNRTAVLKFLEANDILSAGRFGEWDYYWSDQSLISGIENAGKIN